MSKGKKHWRSSIKFLEATTTAELQTLVNEFCEDKFVVGIQYPEALQSEAFFLAVISWKYQESESSK